ncbi:hypothetical protein HII31_03717 [Pseudocercospora fuligena]|uniref:VOC domain-containing protein n=1 Tax=Pseudocercospora fuligena TaxID=685502 RepID=A0A8H6VJS6_9PEZI|nr:hypothetical protein HII31_03717 [Pseudocercospora fuligena]
MSTKPTSTTEELTQCLETPFLGNAIEICIVTPNLKSTLEGLVRLGIGPFKIFKFTPETVTNQMIHGKPASFSIDVAFAEQKNMVWEVMQPISGPTLMQKYLEDTNGKGGIQHVSFDCKKAERGEGKGDLVGEAARLEAKRRKDEFEKRGFPLAQSGVWHGKRGTCEFMFFDTVGAVNTCFESYVFSDDWEDPHDVEWFPERPEEI